MYNHEQVKDLINQRLNDEVWTETLVLEEADGVERQGPAPPPEKSTAKKPDKRTKKGDKTQKEDSMYIFIKGGVYWRVYRRVCGGILESTNFGIVSGNPYRDQLKEDELPSDSLREVQDGKAISFGLKDKCQITAVRNYLNRTKEGFNLKQVSTKWVPHRGGYRVSTGPVHNTKNL